MRQNKFSTTKPEASPHRGRLRLFFGMAPGVGKTYTLIAEAHQQLAAGKRVLLVSLDAHQRADIKKLAADLPQLVDVTKKKQPVWMSAALDLEAIKAYRPQIVLIDEMAVANPPGCKHAHRWQDIEELQDAGIEVWSTLNVQHLESQKEAIGKLTGFAVTETIPDRIFLSAEEVRFIDLPPDDLLARVDAGKVFLPAVVERAKQGYFRKSNLIALREQALRAMMDRMEQHVNCAHPSSKLLYPDPAIKQRLLLLLESVDLGSIQRASTMAHSLDVALHVVWLQSAHNLPGTAKNVIKLLEFASSLGATTDILVNVSTLTIRTYCKQHRVAFIALVSDARWRVMRREILLRWLVPDITLISLARHNDQKQNEPIVNKGWQFLANRSNYTKACGLVVLLSCLIFPFRSVLEPTNCAMIYLLGVLVCGLNFGRAATALAAFLSVFVFDFAMIRPQWSLSVADSQYLITFAVMLTVGVVAGQLMASRQQLSLASNERERQTRHLFDATRAFSSAITIGDVFQILEQALKNDFRIGCELWWPRWDEENTVEKKDKSHALLLPIGGSLKNTASAVVYWCWENQKPAGRGTATLPSQEYWYLPLVTGKDMLGVLVLSTARQPETDSTRRAVSTLVSLAAQAMQRIVSTQDVRKLMVAMEADKLRNTLLQSVSHDLRTPITLLKMVAEDLLARLRRAQQKDSGGDDLVDDAQQMVASTTRIENMVVNLLELARLQAGQIQLHMSWIPIDELISTAKSELGNRLLAFQLQIHIDSDCPTVYGDEVLLTRVLVNLLDNAMKYCPAGSRIECRVWRQGQNIAICVSDNGPGLPPGDPERLFAPFQRGQKESPITGVGLGLAICRTIMQAHKGSIQVGASKLGGTAFTLLLPDVPLEALDDEDVILAKESKKENPASRPSSSQPIL